MIHFIRPTHLNRSWLIQHRLLEVDTWPTRVKVSGAACKIFRGRTCGGRTFHQPVEVPGSREIRLGHRPLRIDAPSRRRVDCISIMFRMAGTPSAICDNCAVQTPLHVLKGRPASSVIQQFFFPVLKEIEEKPEKEMTNYQRPARNLPTDLHTTYKWWMIADRTPFFRQIYINVSSVRVFFFLPRCDPLWRWQWPWNIFFFWPSSSDNTSFITGHNRPLGWKFQEQFQPASVLQVSIDVMHVTFDQDNFSWFSYFPESGNAAPYCCCVDWCIASGTLIDQVNL